MVSPNKNPQGFTDSMWSKITFIMAKSGMERNMPGIPHMAFPTKTTMIEKRALILWNQGVVQPYL